MPAYLGHVQRAIIARLAEGEQTTVTLADIASSSVVGNSPGILSGKGLARVTGFTPAKGGRGGRPMDMWSITPKGREALAEVTSVHPGRLVASGVPDRADSTLEADWAMALIILAWAEGHGQCGGLRPGPVPERPECTCGGLRFQVFRPVRMTPSELAAVVLPGTREAAR